jgi:hypothetical protein
VACFTVKVAQQKHSTGQSNDRTPWESISKAGDTNGQHIAASLSPQFLCYVLATITAYQIIFPISLCDPDRETRPQLREESEEINFPVHPDSGEQSTSPSPCFLLSMYHTGGDRLLFWPYRRSEPIPNLFVPSATFHLK